MFYLSFVSILQITSHPALNSRHGCQGWFKPGWKPNLLQDNFVSIHTKFGHRKTRSALILAERKWKYASLGIRFLYIYMKIEYYNIIYLNIYIYSIIYKIYSRTCSAQLFLGSISSVCSTAQLWPHGSRWTDVVIMFAVLVWDSYNCEINMKERDICVETKTIFWGGSVNSETLRSNGMSGNLIDQGACWHGQRPLTGRSRQCATAPVFIATLVKQIERMLGSSAKIPSM